MTEEWRPVVGFEGLYEVSDHGRVRSVDKFIERSVNPYWLKGRPIQPGMTAGRPVVTLRHLKVKKRTVGIGVLVAEAFLGPRPEGYDCCHFDDDPLNNHVDNLRWDTRRSNLLDAVRNGLHYFSRRDACKYGHEYTPENTIVVTRKGDRSRACRKCARDRDRAYNDRCRSAKIQKEAS